MIEFNCVPLAGSLPPSSPLQLEIFFFEASNRESNLTGRVSDDRVTTKLNSCPKAPNDVGWFKIPITFV